MSQLDTEKLFFATDHNDDLGGTISTASKYSIDPDNPRRFIAERHEFFIPNQKQQPRKNPALEKIIREVQADMSSAKLTQR